MTSKGRKDDHGKVPWSLLPLEAVEEVLRVLYWGAYEKKPKPYGPNNWQGVANARQRYYDAAMRHLTDWWKRYQSNPAGDMSDHESGFHILAHAGCDILFVLWFDMVARATLTVEPVDKERCSKCRQEWSRHTRDEFLNPICPPQFHGD